jgi:hypothetical protein
MELEACCASSIHPKLYSSHTPCQLRLITGWATDVSGCAPKRRTTQMHYSRGRLTRSPDSDRVYDSSVEGYGWILTIM